MAKYDPLESQCELRYTAGTVTESPFGIPDHIQIYFSKDGEDDPTTYYVDWKYHCPGGEEASSPSEGYKAGDIVMVECDKNQYPLRVIGHADGAEPCDITYCVAWFASDTVYLKYNEVNRFFNCYNAVRLAYIEKGFLSHFNGIAGVVSLQYADNNPYRFTICLELNTNGASEYWLGRFCFITVAVDLDNTWSPFTSNVYFYGINKLYDVSPYFDDHLLVDCDGYPIPSEADSWNEDACPGVNFSNSCTDSSLELGCVCGEKGDGLGCPGGSCYTDPCSCRGVACWSPTCCQSDICDTHTGSITMDGTLRCSDCKCYPYPVGAYLLGDDIGQVILAGLAYYDKAEFHNNEDYSASCTGGSVLVSCACDPCPTGGPPIHYDRWNNFVPLCTGALGKQFNIWGKAINEIAAPDVIDMGVDLGVPDTYIETDPSHVWNPNFNSDEYCGTDDCQWGDSYQYTYTPLRMIGHNKWTYRYSSSEFVHQLDGAGPSCECATGVNDVDECVTVGFSYTFPTNAPEGVGDGGWVILQNMLKGSLESYAIAWVYGSGMSNFVSTSPLGNNLELDEGLDNPLEDPSFVAILISDINNSGFAISVNHSKIRAYAGWEVNPETGKLRPTSDYIYEWDIGFGGMNAFMRGVCYMVYQPEV